MQQFEKIILTILFLLVLIATMNAQNEKFEWLLMSESDGSTGIIDLVSDDLGNTYVIGFSYKKGLKIAGKSYPCLTTEHVVYFYAKFDASSNLVWLRQFDPTQKTHAFHPEKIELDGQDNIYIFGVLKGKVNICETGKSYYVEGGSDNQEFLAKYNQQGDVLWAKVYKDGFYNEEREFVVDKEGYSYLLGYRANVAKIDPQGNELFRTYLPNGFTPGDIFVKNDKIYITTTIIGDYNFTINLADGTKIEGEKIAPKEGYFYNTELLIACLSGDNGSILWADLVRSYMGENSKGIVVDNNGNVTISGVCCGKASFGISSKKYLKSSYQQYDKVPFIAQYTENGKLKWIKELDIKDKDRNSGSHPLSLDIEPQSGNIYSTRTHCNDKLWWAVYYEKFDSNGNLLDEKTFGYDSIQQKNIGFYKISCGSADFFVHVNPNTNNLYLFGEVRYGFEPGEFGLNSHIKSGGEYKFFICKKSIGAGPANIIQPITPKNTNNGKTSWQGTWETYWDTETALDIRLSENNGGVQGNYDYKEGKITANTVEENGQTVLLGKWQQYTLGGWFKFYQSPDGNSFTGEWGYTENEVEGTWNGVKK